MYWMITTRILKESKMHLSPAYQKNFWILVYHTQPGSLEVELITTKLFKSKAKAEKWFARKRKTSDFIQPETVMVSGLDKLYVRRDLPEKFPTTIDHVVPSHDRGISLYKPYDPMDFGDDEEKRTTPYDESDFGL